MVKINNVADFGTSFRNRAELFINGKRIRLNKEVVGYRREYHFHFRLKTGVYKIKAKYYAVLGRYEEKYNITTQDGKFRIYPDQRTVVSIKLDKKLNGDLKSKKNYFMETYVPLSAKISHSDVTRPPTKIVTKPSQKMLELPQNARGRNMGQGNFSLGLRHTYRKVETELIKRKLITSDGTTTTTEDVSVASGQEEDFTSLHMDSLRLRLGLTDYLEVFAEIDGTYQELSDPRLAYGGGLRLNLFAVKGGWLRGFYSGLQGEYLGGAVEYEYNSSDGNIWKKEADWEEFLAKWELGVARSGFASYLGLAYFHYREDTKLQLLENLPSSLSSYVFQDETEKESFGAYGGVVIHLTPAVLVAIEGQVLSQESIFGALEYHF
jgi:hypothetical protein